MKRRTTDLVCGLVLLACAGCGEEGARVAVSGTVSRDGHPVEEGRIVFSPANGTQGPAAGTAIKDGCYRIPAAQGPHEGHYTVTVTPGGVPRKQAVMSEPPKESPNRGQSFQFDREITRDNPQVDIVLPPRTRRHPPDSTPRQTLWFGGDSRRDA